MGSDVAMGIGKHHIDRIQPLLDMEKDGVLFFLMKFSAGVLAGALLILCWPMIKTQITHMVRPDVGSGTSLTTPQASAAYEHIVMPDAAVEIPEPSSSDEIISKAITDEATSQYCSESCQVAKRLVNHLVDLSDEEAEAILANAHRLANAVRQNADLQSRLLQIATTLTGAQRQLLINAFYLLEPEDRRSLGMVLDASPYPNQRLDGIQLMASADVLDTTTANHLAGRGLEEPEVHVREALVRALNQPEILRGDLAVLQALQQMQSIEQNDTVRGQALLAQASLSVNPEPFIKDSIAAIRSGQDGYAADGALALERILVQISRNEAQVTIDNKAAIQQLMDDLMKSESMAPIPQALRVSLDDLYARFF